MKNNIKRAIVLIDDDEAFCHLMLMFAKSRGIDLHYFSDLEELGYIGRLDDYQAAIIDYDLGRMRGDEIAEYLPAFFGDMPTVLISAAPRKPRSIEWPKAVKKFVLKDVGPDAILDATLHTINPTRGAA